MQSDNDNQTGKSEFEKASGSSKIGFFAELFEFMSQNKKWWLLPIIIVLLLFAALIILGSTGAAPFIYTLF
jgi:hypothetical protein